MEGKEVEVQEGKEMERKRRKSQRRGEREEVGGGKGGERERRGGNRWLAWEEAAVAELGDDRSTQVSGTALYVRSFVWPYHGKRSKEDGM